MSGIKVWALGALLWTAAAGAQAASPVPVEAFANYAKIYSPRMSPDGQNMSVTADLGEGNYALAVYRISDMKQLSLLKFARYELPAQVAWVSPRRLVIAKGRKIGTLEEPVPMGEIISTDYDGTNRRYVYGREHSTRTAGIDRGFGYIEALPRTANGRFYMRALSMGSNRSMLYDVDTEKSTQRLVADIDQRQMGFALDADGKARYAMGTDDDDTYLLFEADAKGGWQRIPTERVGGKMAPFISDDGQIYGRFSRDGGPAALVRWDGVGKEHEVLASDTFASVGALQWTATPRRPFAATSGAGIPSMRYLDESIPEVATYRMLREGFSGSYVDYVDHSEDGTISLLYVHSDRDPGSWHLFDRKQQRVSRILTAREGIDPARMGKRRPFRFKASDGLELDGFMTLPAGVDSPAGLPMVLIPHGGPHAPGDSWSFDTDAQFLASRGYLVLQVNFRGSQGRGRTFEEAGYLKWGTRIQEDLIDGVRWAIGQGYADPGRVCAYGASFGAYSAMMVAARAPELFKCAAGFAGVYDLRMMYSKGDIRNTAWGRNYLRRVIGRDDEELRANSPTSLAARIAAPVLLIHGDEDDRTPIAQAVAMRNALQAAGQSPEYMAVPKEGHGFYKDENNVARLNRLESFIGRHIGGGTH